MAAPAGLRQRKKEQTARAIMDTALQLVRRKGYEGTTVEEVVRNLDLSQPTFYNYFASLDDLLRKITVEIMDDWARAAAGKTFPGASVRSILRAKYRRLADAITADPALWRAIFLVDAVNPLRDRRRPGADLELEILQQATMERGRKSGELNRNFNAVFLSRSLDAIQFSICMDWSLADRRDSLRKRLDRGLEFFFRGAAGAQGS